MGWVVSLGQPLSSGRSFLFVILSEAKNLFVAILLRVAG